MKKLFLAVIILSMMFTGCMDAQEIDQRNFVLSLGIDKGEEDVFQVTMGIANPAIKVENSIGHEIKNANGNTLAVAMETGENKLKRSMYYGHTKNIIISKEVISEERMLEDIVDSLMRSNKFSLKTVILCAEGEAGQLIEEVEKEEQGDGLYIWDFYKNNGAKVNTTMQVTLKDLEEGVREENFVIPFIKFQEGVPTIGGGAVYDGKKVREILTEEDMTGYALATRNCAGDILQVHLEGEEVPIFIKRSSFKEKKNQGENILEIKIKADIKGEGNLKGYDKEEMKKAEEALEESVKRRVKKALASIEAAGGGEGKREVEVKAKIIGTGVIK